MANIIREQLIKDLKQRQAVRIPDGWQLIGGCIAMPPKLTPEQWIERQDSEPFTPPEDDQKEAEKPRRRMPWE